MYKNSWIKNYYFYGLDKWVKMSEKKNKITWINNNIDLSKSNFNYFQILIPWGIFCRHLTCYR